ncbi:MAG: GGDEF domain-containing protein [Proteobacteria bacterium]|nr:GGDEF domain-containing protein [Pseudomonadota bacterium]
MEVQKDLPDELDQANAKFAALSDEFQRNMSILRRSYERELTLLNAEDIAELFRNMTKGLRESYGLEKVTVVFADPDHDVRHLLIAGGAEPDELPDLQLVEALTGLAPQYIALRRPWLGPYKASDHSLIFPGSSNIRSMAMIPLIHKGALLGSINFGSADESRFTREHATDFFAHLGAIASFALENVVNRARLLRSGFTDVLTGWNNRRYLQVRLVEELARARRDASGLVCLMLDIDHFKKVNDSYGHAAGDAVLRELAQRIESQVRVSDVAARYGGEEFVVLLPGTEIESGTLLAERIRKAVSANPIEIGGGNSITITVSIGIASIAPIRDGDDLKTTGESLLARADVALYSAKSSGRDRVAAEHADQLPAMNKAAST